MLLHDDVDQELLTELNLANEIQTTVVGTNEASNGEIQLLSEPGVFALIK
jgi:hypothetical protein